ncbi:MAG: GAF domain-containing protein [Anaerolineales bacterium]|nr:GAF domain-containing protein [Anaerolineales bacterium]
MTATPAPDNARLSALYDVSRALGSTLNLDEALTLALDSAIRLTSAERGFLMMFDGEAGDGELVFRLARSAKQETLEESAFEVSRSVVREVAQNNTPVVTTNAQKDPRFSTQESVINYALRSIMAVPLTVRGKTIGALYVDNKARAGLFAQPDLDLLRTFAGQAAIAIENARLYTQTDQALAQRISELQTMQMIDRQLNATLDFEKVMAMTLEWAARYTAARTGWIGILEEGDQGQQQVRIIARHGTSGTRPLSAGTPSVGNLKPIGDPLVQSAFAVRQVQRFPADPASGAPARLLAPVVIHDDRIVAVIVLERPNHPFTANAGEFLARLADHAAVAIENARLYNALKRANDAKSEFVRTVSHELKLPMTSIKGYADLMLHGIAGPISDQQKQFLQTIRSNVERMAVLVSDLADISRIEAGRIKIDLKAVDVSQAIQEALKSVQTSLDSKHQTVIVNIPVDLPRARTDPGRLAQVLTNLLSNANKYSPPEARIAVLAEADPPNLRVSVEDTGYGISPQDQEKLFTAFFRSEEPTIRQETGWGLGLHLSRRLVEVLGGEIMVTSRTGQGSTFSFTVPIDT